LETAKVISSKDEYKNHPLVKALKLAIEQKFIK